MTDVTIRGIDDETYSSFAAEAKKKGVSIGDLTTTAMRALLDQSSSPVFRIGNLEDLSVSKNDLESVDRPVILENIETLVFDDTVDWETFNKHILSVNNIETVKTHKGLSKFQILTKGRNIESFR